MNINEFIKPELLILVPVLNLVGYGIKKTSLDNRFIPVILGAIAVVLAGVYIFATEPISGAQAVSNAVFTAITQGVLVAGASVYFNQIYKQTKE